MKRLRLARLILMMALVSCVSIGQTVGALGPVLISGVQVKGVGANTSSLEAVEVKNYSDGDIDVTGWCVAYASYSASTIPAGGNCIIPYRSGDKVFIKKQSSIVFTTNELTALIKTTNSTFVPDAVLTSGLSNTTGQMHLVDGSRQSKDLVKWITASANITGQVNLKPISGQPENISFSRVSFSEDGSSGFAASPLSLTFGGGGLYDALDACTNIVGFQDIVPDGLIEADGVCTQPDVCSNITGIQSSVPDGLVLLNDQCVSDICPNMMGVQPEMPIGYMKDEQGDCRIDICTNIAGLQIELPSGYAVESGECEALESRALLLNEVMANASGSDSGLEYIELYNPYDEVIKLNGYRLLIGKSLEKSYVLPTAQEIAPKSYFVITNAQLPYTLLNTMSSVALVAPSGMTVSSTSYADPEDDMSWSFVSGVWQYTNQKTPGVSNRLSGIATDETTDHTDIPTVTTLAACSAGKYRHPLTNRCRNIETDVVTLASCDGDEYRNPETNRCRKLSTLTSSLAACAEGQERNPDTNRCRSVLSATSTLTSCQTGYERNPETNRCRKIVTSATDSPLKTAAQASASGETSPYVIGGGIALLAIGYWVFEWRTELLGFVRRIIPIAK